MLKQKELFGYLPGGLCSTELNAFRLLTIHSMDTFPESISIPTFSTYILKLIVISFLSYVYMSVDTRVDVVAYCLVDMTSFNL